MLYLVSSSPHPANDEGLSERQRKFWDWMARLEAEGRVLHGWRRMGRGAVVIFDVPDHGALHDLLRQWAHLIPAAFDAQPLLARPGAAGDPPNTSPRR
ncbi:MAG: muconolactone Delta-isomerase family protein [Pigmentiphaga sp.]|nr:muconolactone Delta-isomerase family protein [Pigmentiphaga sp.]